MVRTKALTYSPSMATARIPIALGFRSPGQASFFLRLLGAAAMLFICAACAKEKEDNVPLFLQASQSALDQGGCAASGCHASTVLGEYPTTSAAHVSAASMADRLRGHVYQTNCTSCHNGYDRVATHRDGILTRVGVVFSVPDPANVLIPLFTYNEATQGCSSACHVSQTWSGSSGNFNRASGDCTQCHSNSYSFAPAPRSGSHTAHLQHFATGGNASEVSTGLAAQGLPVCAACHNGYFGSNQHGNKGVESGGSLVSYHPQATNGARPGLDVGTTGTYDASTGTCSTACHGLRTWQ